MESWPCVLTYKSSQTCHGAFPDHHLQLHMTIYGILTIAIYLLAGSALAAPDGDPRSIFARAKCNADNCLRAIDGTRRGSSFAAAATEQCSAFLRTTVTPSPT